MKKITILVLSMLMLTVLAFAVNSSRPYYQEVIAGKAGVDIRTIVTNTGNTTNSNYTVTCDILETTGEVLSTATTSATSLRLVKLGTAPNDYVAVYVQLSTFTTQWANGNTVRWTVTYTGAGQYNGQSTTWDEVLTSTLGGTGGTINLRAPLTRNIPPLLTTDPNPTLATTPSPANGATGVAVSTANVGWNYTTNAAYTDPVGYKVYFGTNSNPSLNTMTYVSGMATHVMPVTLSYATHYYWKVVPTTVAAKKALASISARAIRNGAKGDASGALTWDFTTEDAPILNKDIQVTATVPSVKIYRNTVYTGFKTPHTFNETIGANVTYAVESIPILITPDPQTITVAVDQTLTFTYTPRPNDVAGGATYVPVAAPVVIPVAPVLAGTDNFTVTVNPAAPALFVVTSFAPPAKGNYEGYQNVWQVFNIWTNDTTALDGTDVQIQYANDAPYEVAIHWGGVANGFYPHAGPWSGYLFNGGPATSLSQPLGAAPFINSTYVNGAPNNTLTVGPLPAYAAKGEGTLELILNDGTHTLPVELSSFTAIATAQMFVNLQWTTESETNNLGFNVLRSSDSNVANAEQVNLSMISGTNGSVQHTYSFTDREVEAGASYYYWLQSTDFDGTVHLSNYVMVTTNNNNTIVTPVVNVTSLQNAYPNPFQMGGRTNIGVNVKTGETADLTIYNVLGKVVKTATFQSGTTNYQWDGKDYKGAACGSGIYFYKLTSPSHNETKKMVVVK